MIVKNIQLHNFRNYPQLDIDFSDKMNILYGENAQGKTNILEAVFLCSTGRSHRTQKDAEMVMFGEESASVALELERRNYGTFIIEIEILRTGRKSIKINGVPQKRAGDLLGRLNCAIFSPEDLAIIKNEPQQRRRFLDMLISQIKPSYYFNLHSYLGALRQRNTLLRQLRENRSLLGTVGAWDAQLAEFGSKVMRERHHFVNEIGISAKGNHYRITGGGEDLDVAYEPSLKYGESGSPQPSEPGIKEAFARALEQGLQSDIARMSTQCGPHKDDISCAIGGRSLRLYGSQGQQRTAALALKMSQVDVMAHETGDTPVLLLDDVMSELDQGRRGNLSANMKSAQVFVTGTDRYEPGAGACTQYEERPGSASGIYYFLVQGGIASRVCQD